MSKGKSEFKLEYNGGVHCGWIRIGNIVHENGKLKNKQTPYVYILTAGKDPMFIKDKDLKRFAVNILKALNSDKIKK